MNLSKKQLARNKNPAEREMFELVTENGKYFYSFGGNLYKSDIVRSCVSPFTRAIGKMQPRHIRRTADDLKVWPEPYMKMLLMEPNPLMGGQVFWEKMSALLLVNRNAFAYILRDVNGYATQLYPITASSVEAVKTPAGGFMLRFCMRGTGQIIDYDYSNILHLRLDFMNGDIFGDDPREALLPLMEIVSTTDQGIVSAVKNGAAIRWLLKYSNTLRPEDITAKVKSFVKTFLGIDSETGGAAAVDNTCTAEQVKPQDYVPNAIQVDRVSKRIYEFFGTNENIIQSKFTENEWVAYYENMLEPVAMQMAAELTRKLFSRRERAAGNEIVFDATNLQYSSMSTKLGLQAMVDRGAMTPNEWRGILGLSPIEGGDKAIRRLDTEPVGGDPMNE